MEVVESNKKAITQYSKNGDYVSEYNSTSEAALATKISLYSISRCCNGYSKTSGGFIWQFKNDINKSNTGIVNYYTKAICNNCGKEFDIQKWRLKKRKNVFCSKKCESEFRKSKDLNCVCEVCGKKYHLKPYQLYKYRHHFCSIECKNKAMEEYMLRDGNHQYGLKGKLNASWKSDEKISYYGYKLIRCLNHPFKNCDDFVFEHRLIAEKYLLNDKNSIIINGIKYLSPDYDVHHKDFDRLNNNINNLEVILHSEHMKLHWKLRKQ